MIRCRKPKIKPMSSVRRRGISLMEVLLASAILAFAVAAIAQAIVAGQMQTYAALHELRAMSLAESLVEEILAKPYADPEGVLTAGPDSGEANRSLFDNCDDYHGYSEAVNNVKDMSLTAYPSAFQVFRRSVTAVYGTAASGMGAPVTGLTVTVTVTDSTNRTWVASRFIPKP